MCVVSQLVATEEHLKVIIAEHLKEIILTSCPETPSSCYKDLNEAAGQRGSGVSQRRLRVLLWPQMAEVAQIPGEKTLLSKREVCFHLCVPSKRGQILWGSLRNQLPLERFYVTLLLNPPR